MKIVSAKFERKFNLGDYEHKIFGLEARVDEGDKGAVVLAELEADVIAAFKGESAPVQTEVQPAGKAGRKRKPKKGEENVTSSEAGASDDEDAHDESSESEDAGNDGESDQDHESTDGEDRDDNDDSTDSGEESDEGSDEGGEEEPEPEAPKKGKGKKGSSEASGGSKKSGFRKKPQAYDRSVEQHKEIFSGILKSVNPDWKKNEASKLKAKSVSEKMAGKNFLDDDGEVLPEFSAEVKKLMAAKK